MKKKNKTTQNKTKKTYKNILTYAQTAVFVLISPA